MTTTLSRWNALEQCIKCAAVIDADVWPFNGNLDWAKEEHIVIDHNDLTGQTRYFARANEFPVSQFAAALREALR